MAEVKGRCMCGAIAYKATGEMYGIVSCHCKECQRLHGNYNPMLVVDKTNFVLEGEGDMGWYDSSEDKNRGFCNVCGAALFMRQKNGPKILISAGSLDDPYGFKNVKNIFTEEAGSYYVMPPEEV